MKTSKSNRRMKRRSSNVNKGKSINGSFDRELLSSGTLSSSGLPLSWTEKLKMTLMVPVMKRFNMSLKILVVVVLAIVSVQVINIEPFVL